MAKIIKIPSFYDKRGTLSVIDNLLPFEIKRFYYIYDIKEKRGGHAHKRNRQLLICLFGSCEVFVCNKDGQNETFLLDSPSKGLLLEAKDWHTMDNFKENSVLLVLASEPYDEDDYIVERICDD